MEFKNDQIADKVETEMRLLEKNGANLSGGAQYNRVFEAFYRIFNSPEFTTPTKEAGTDAVEKAFKRGYDLGHDGGCIEGASGYYADACWQTYKHENKI